MTQAIYAEVVRHPSQDPSEAIQPGYTSSELRWRLAKVRGRKLPYRTLKYWIDQLGMTPDPDTGLYTEDDLNLLRRLVLALKRKMTIKQFMYSVLEEI